MILPFDSIQLKAP